MRQRAIHSKRLYDRIVSAFLPALLLILVFPASSLAETQKLSDAQLKSIYCKGATNLYIEDNTVRLFLDMHTETYGEIDSAKLAYYEKDGMYNWDINWNDLTLGEAMDTPLVTDGLIIRTEFDDISASGKKLTRIMIGTEHMDGRISGDFTTTTGAVHPDVVGSSATEPIVMNRGSDLQSHNHMDIANNGFFIDINFDGSSPERGIKTIIGYSESQAMDFTFGGSNWWQQ